MTNLLEVSPSFINVILTTIYLSIYDFFYFIFYKIGFAFLWLIGYFMINNSKIDTLYYDETINKIIIIYFETKIIMPAIRITGLQKEKLNFKNNIIEYKGSYYLILDYTLFPIHLIDDITITVKTNISEINKTSEYPPEDDD